MAGLGLTSALQGYMQGRAWRDNQDQQDLEKQRREKINAANQAAMGYVEEAKKAHEADQAAQMQAWAQKNGTTDGFKATQFRPGDRVMFTAAARRGDALLGAGLFDEYAKNRAMLIPMQMQARQQAWQRFKTDGDVGALGQSMYDTIPDGRHVKSYDMVDGTGPNGKKTGAKIRFQLDDGTTQLLNPDDVVKRATEAMRDPQKSMEQEFAMDLWKAKEKTRGETDKDVNAHKHGLSLAEIEARGKVAQGLADTRADASMYGADRRAEASVHNAGLRAAGGGRGGASNIQKTLTDDDGFVVTIRRDGSASRLLVDGKPVKAGEYGKRVDKLASDIGKSLGGFGKTPEELRAAAEQALGGGQKPAAAGEKKDHSSLWK